MCYSNLYIFILKWSPVYTFTYRRQFRAPSFGVRTVLTALSITSLSPAAAKTDMLKLSGVRTPFIVFVALLPLFAALFMLFHDKRAASGDTNTNGANNDHGTHQEKPAHTVQRRIESLRAVILR